MVVLTQPAIAHVLIKACGGSHKVLRREIQEEKTAVTCHFCLLSQWVNNV